jgi:hypothetical protein
MTWNEIYGRLNEVMRNFLRLEEVELWSAVRDLRTDIIAEEWEWKELDPELMYVVTCLGIVLKAIDDKDWKLAHTILGLALIYSWMKLQQEGKEQGSEN